MTYGLVKFSLQLCIGALTTAGLLAACGSSQKNVDVPAPHAAANNTPNGGTDPGFQPNLPANAQANTADLYPQFPDGVFAQYLDPSIQLDYTVTYDPKQPQSGSVKLVNGKGTIKISGLPVGKTWDLSIKMFQAGKLKLTGTKAALTLVSGPNNVPLTLTDANGASVTPGSSPGSSGAGSATAELDILIDTSGASGANSSSNAGGPTVVSPTNSSTNAPGQPSGVKYADVASLAVRYCQPCHSGSDSKNLGVETGWTSRGKTLLVGRLTGTGGNKMPQGTTGISSDDLAKLVAYANTLSN